MRRLLPKLAMAAVLALVGAASPAMAAKRMALVVGNDAYENVAKLQKAVNDVRAVATALAAIGFTVLKAENVTRRGLNEKLQELASLLQPGDEALFYFAGHGIEIDGRNYLLAVDVPAARPGHEEIVKSEGVAVDRILDIIRSRGSRVSIMVLDACRDNPFARTGTRSLGATRGLGATPAPEGAFILYSAGVGQSALDRLGGDDRDPNSVFTRKLVPLLSQPGLPLVQAARQLRQEVQELALSVGHDQRPAYYDEVVGEFYFARPVAPEARRQPEAPHPAFEPAAQAWAVTKDSTSPAVLEAFIARFPGTVYADLASARLKELQAQLTMLPPEGPERPAGHAAASPALAVEEPSRTGSEPRTQVAGLDPGAGFDEANAARSLQGELLRLGCYTGPVDGIWGSGSRDALAAFAEHSGKGGTFGDGAYPTDARSFERLFAVLKDKPSRVCPLVCGPRFNQVDDACVLKTCPRGQALGSDGVCRRPPTAATQRSPSGSSASRPTRSSPSARQSGDCFIVDGRRVC